MNNTPYTLNMNNATNESRSALLISYRNAYRKAFTTWVNSNREIAKLTGEKRRTDHGFFRHMVTTVSRSYAATPSPAALVHIANEIADTALTAAEDAYVEKHHREMSAA